MLCLIGLGLADGKDITLKGLDAVKKCAKAYLECYTSGLACSREDLENLYGRKLELANRDFVENAEVLLKEAKDKDVALLVVGDPLCATTHWDVLQRAKALNIKTEVIHNASIVSAVGAVGLQVYKFGKTTSIPFPKENFEPESYYDIIKENKSIGAHSLVLLDLDPVNNRFMSVNEGIELLRMIERKRNQRVFMPDDWCIGIARLGAKDQKIVSGTVIEVSDADFGSGPQCFIVPGRLHFVEEEVLGCWK